MGDIPSRSDVIAKNADRKTARQLFQNDRDIAKGQLAPSHLAERWKTRQSKRAEALVVKGKTAARDNAALIGVAAAGAILFAARKPIAKAYKKLKERKA